MEWNDYTTVIAKEYLDEDKNKISESSFDFNIFILSSSMFYIYL